MSVHQRAQREPRNAPIWIKLFVAMHILGIVVWSLPHPPKSYTEGNASFGVRLDGVGPFLQSTRDLLSDGPLYFNERYMRPSPLKYYVLITGFWQYWDMFSPNPASTDLWGDADVTLQDGSKVHYAYPRIYDLPIPEKYLKERYRKFYERANSEDKTHIWPFFAQQIADIVNKEHPGNPPVKVELVRHWQDVAPPGKEQQGYYQFKYFEWKVDQDALREHRQINEYSMIKIEKGFYRGWAVR